MQKFLSVKVTPRATLAQKTPRAKVTLRAKESLRAYLTPTRFLIIIAFQHKITFKAYYSKQIKKHLDCKQYT